MKRKLRPRKSPYQLKDEQVNFLPEHIEKNLEGCKKIVETKDKQLAEVKKNTAKTKKLLQSSYKRK